MLFLEFSTGSQDIRGNVVDCCLKKGSSSTSDSIDVLTGDSSRTEDASVCEPLSGEISDWKFGEDDVGSHIVNLLKFIVDDLPFSVNYALEIVDVANTDFSVFLF